jgi:hypothetical protein
MIVLFDVDGVLIRAFEFGKWLKQTYSLCDDDLNDFFNGSFSECSEGKADLKHTLRPYLKRWHFPYSVDEFCKMWFEKDGTRLHAGQALLRDCLTHQMKTGIATTQEAYRKQYLLHHYPEIQNLDYHFFSCDVGYKKPRPEFFETVSECSAHRIFCFSMIHKSMLTPRKHVDGTEYSMRTKPNSLIFSSNPCVEGYFTKREAVTGERQGRQER